MQGAEAWSLCFEQGLSLNGLLALQPYHLLLNADHLGPGAFETVSLRGLVWSGTHDVDQADIVLTEALAFAS